MIAPLVKLPRNFGLFAVGIALLLSQSCGQKQPTPSQIPILASAISQPPTETIPHPTATKPPQPTSPTATTGLPTATIPRRTPTIKPLTATIPTPTSTPSERTVPPQFLARLNQGHIYDIVIAPQRDWIAVVGGSHICLFDTGHFEQTWCKPTELPAQFQEGKLPDGTPDETVLALTFHPDGKQIAYSLWNGYIVFLDRATGQRLRVMDTYFLNSVDYLGWSQDGKRMVIQSEEHGIDIWDMVAGEQVGHLDISPDTVAGVAWSPDNRVLAVGLFKDGKITLWDSTTFEQIDSLETAPYGSSFKIVWSPDGRYLYAIVNIYVKECDRGLCDTNICRIKAWDLATGEVAFDIDRGEDIAARLALSANGKWLAIGSAGWVLTVNDAVTGIEMAKQPKTSSLLGLFWLAGDRLAYCSHLEAVPDRTLSLWDIGTDELSYANLEGFEPIYNYAWLPDGERLMTNSSGGTVSIWQARTGQRLEQFQFLIGNTHLSSFGPTSISPVGGKLVTSAEGETMIVDVETRQVIQTLEYDEKTSYTHIGFPSWSKDEKRLAGIVYDVYDAVAVWEVETGKLLLKIPYEGQVMHAMALSPDGTRLALDWRTEDGEHLFIWDIESNKPVVSVDLSCSIFDLTWLGEDLVSFHGIKGSEIWDLTAVKQLRVFDKGSIIAVSPDGSLAAMTEYMGVIAIRDISSGKKLASFKVETVYIFDATFSPDGRLLATVTEHGSAIIWDVSEFYRR